MPKILYFSVCLYLVLWLGFLQALLDKNFYSFFPVFLVFSLAFSLCFPTLHSFFLLIPLCLFSKYG